MSLREGSSRVERRNGPGENRLADLAIMVQVGPTAAELDEDSASRVLDTCGHFNQPHAPGAGMSFAQRVALAALVKESFSRRLGQRFTRHFRPRGLRRRIDDPGAKPHEKIQRRGVHVQAKQVSHVAVVAQMIGLNAALDLLVAVLAFAALRVEAEFRTEGPE